MKIKKHFRSFDFLFWVEGKRISKICRLELKKKNDFNFFKILKPHYVSNFFRIKLCFACSVSMICFISVATPTFGNNIWYSRYTYVWLVAFSKILRNRYMLIWKKSTCGNDDIWKIFHLANYEWEDYGIHTYVCRIWCSSLDKQIMSWDAW